MQLSTLLYQRFRISTKQLLPKTILILLSFLQFGFSQEITTPKSNKPPLTSSENLESLFDNYLFQVIDLLTKIPEKDHKKTIDYLTKSWDLYDHDKLLKEIKLKYNIKDSEDSQLENFKPKEPEEIIYGLTKKEFRTAQRKIAKLGKPDGAPKPDMEGIVWGLAVVSNAIDNRNNSQNNYLNHGIPATMIRLLNKTADFLVDTTTTAKATEFSLTHHRLLDPKETLGEKIRAYKETEDLPSQSKKVFASKFLRSLWDNGFGRVSLEIDTNASSFEVSSMSLSLFRLHLGSWEIRGELFGGYKEGQEFKYQTGPGFKGLTPSENAR